MRSIIGFDSREPVPPGETRSVSTVVDKAFQANRILIPGSLAPSFIVKAVKVRDETQFCSEIGVPAEAFVPEAQSPVVLDRAQKGETITIIVTNRSQSGERFLASMYGDGED